MATYNNAIHEQTDEVPMDDTYTDGSMLDPTNNEKEELEEEIGGNEAENDSPMKKSRLVWTDSLHKQFVAVVDHLGGPDKAKPKKILELMPHAGLTRENIASHLQKYRQNLRKNPVGLPGGDVAQLQQTDFAAAKPTHNVAVDPDFQTFPYPNAESYGQPGIQQSGGFTFSEGNTSHDAVILNSNLHVNDFVPASANHNDAANLNLQVHPDQYAGLYIQSGLQQSGQFAAMNWNNNAIVNPYIPVHPDQDSGSYNQSYDRMSDIQPQMWTNNPIQLASFPTEMEYNMQTINNSDLQANSLGECQDITGDIFNINPFQSIGPSSDPNHVVLDFRNTPAGGLEVPPIETAPVDIMQAEGVDTYTTGNRMFHYDNAATLVRGAPNGIVHQDRNLSWVGDATLNAQNPTGASFNFTGNETVNQDGAIGLDHDIPVPNKRLGP